MELTKELTIKEANNEIERIDNQLEFYFNKKEQAFNRTQPKPTDIKDSIHSTLRIDSNLEYVALCEKLDPIIDSLQEDKKLLLDFIEKELQRLGKYRELEQLIIYYKEQYVPKSNEEVTWYFISKKVYASESTCKRIYKKYKKQRNI